MPDHPHTEFNYFEPDSGTNAVDVPSDLLERSIWVLHQVLMGGGIVENWDVFKLDGIGGSETDDPPDVIEWRNVNTDANEILRAVIARDGNGLATSITYSFAPDGTTFTEFRIATPVRGTNDGVKRINWSDP